MSLVVNLSALNLYLSRAAVCWACRRKHRVNLRVGHSAAHRQAGSGSHLGVELIHERLQLGRRLKKLHADTDPFAVHQPDVPTLRKESRAAAHWVRSNDENDLVALIWHIRHQHARRWPTDLGQHRRPRQPELTQH